MNEFPIQKKDLINVLNEFKDAIYITDGDGNTLWINESSAQMIGKKPHELVGRNVSDLEKEGMFKPSVTKLAIEAKKTVTTVQEMKDGRKYLVTGYVIWGENRKIRAVVAHSRDITEALKTSSQLEEAEALIREYSLEVSKLRMENDLIKLRNKDSALDIPFVGRSPAYNSLLELIYQVANTDATVLITGETGVGKNIVAKLIHSFSDRKQQQFVHINCAALPESLIESELFGYEKGAFSGASAKGKIGLVQLADKGTLFLDEIGELPLGLQSKLLQLLQDKTYLPIGGTKTRSTDTRIIAATNHDLLKMVKEGKFRKDLYYRLNILSIDIPPLRQRKEDIFPLLYHYLEKFNKKYGKQKSFSNELLDRLQEYEWPGNVRELEHLVERLVITARHDIIEVHDLPETIKNHRVSRIDYDYDNTSLKNILENVEKEVIEQALKKYKTTRTTAKALKMSQTSLMRRLKKYGLNT